jgi:KaiC/GvpD/RAD55 family RecA-like ATPase
MMSNPYFNFKAGLNSKAKLVTLEELSKMQLDKDKDYYLSIYRYNDQHKKQVDATGSIAGIKDVKTDTLVFDFDDATDLNKAREDVITLAERLMDKYSVDPDNIACFTSGNKGFHVVVPLDRDVTPEQFKNITATLAGDLQTFDPVVSDPQRVIRLEYTKHPKSGLFKVPLSAEEISTLSIDEIKNLAKSPREDYEHKPRPVKLPETLFAVKEKKEVVRTLEGKFDPKTTPKGWKDYKWSLAEGFFEEGERHQALMILAATCRGLGYDKTTTYYICKSAIEKQADRNGGEKFDKEELYQNIIERSVFSDNWKGGQYSPASDPWLAAYCKRMNFDVSQEKDEAPAVNFDDLIADFVDYSTNFEQNVIKTGIADLDEHVIFSTSSLNGILGQPGSGKTTVAIEYLKNASAKGVPSMFFSLDMGPPLVFSKLAQKETGTGFKDIMRLFREDVEQRQKISVLLKDKYKNVGFNFRCGSTVSDIKAAILAQSERTGVMPRLIVVDYLENIAGPYSDPTANAAMICNQLKDLATELKVCVVLLLQTQKHSTPDISDPLLSMKQIKGSSVIEQACSVVLTLWREGYSPNSVNDDKYISFALVKNRFGSLGRWDYGWDAIKGKITSLTEEQEDDLKEFKYKKKMAKAAEAAEKNEWGA